MCVRVRPVVVVGGWWLLVECGVVADSFVVDRTSELHWLSEGKWMAVEEEASVKSQASQKRQARSASEYCTSRKPALGVLRFKCAVLSPQYDRIVSMPLGKCRL
jgi:hypothetical protein